MSDHSDCTQGSGVTYQKRDNDHLFSIILKKDIWEKLSVIDVAFIIVTRSKRSLDADDAEVVTDLKSE